MKIKNKRILYIVATILIVLFITTQLNLDNNLIKYSVRLIQNISQGLILYWLFLLFNFKTKKIRLISILFFCLLTLLSISRWAINNFFEYSTLTNQITTIYHFLRSPSVFIFVIPFLFLLKKEELKND